MRSGRLHTASSAVVVIYNDAAYGAEIHQYGSQGLTEKPMLIPEVDFSGSSVRAPWMSEWMQANQAAKAAVAG